MHIECLPSILLLKYTLCKNLLRCDQGDVYTDFYCCNVNNSNCFKKL